MSTDLTTTGYTQEQIELVKRTVARGATNDELSLFLHICQRTGLDPFARQIYAIKRRENVDGNWVDRMTPQTSIDGYRLIADRTGHYAPGRSPTFEYDTDNRLYSATAYVKKRTPDSTWHEVAATAHWSEYVCTKQNGEPTKMWRDKPHIMLAKCAEALALRRAFPLDLSGVYTADEIRPDAEDAEFEERKPAAQEQPQKREALPAPEPEQPKERQAPKKPDNVPKTGKELADRLDGFDQRLAAERRIARGDLVKHVTAAMAGAGHPADLAKLDDRKAILAAVDVAKEFDKAHKDILPAEQPAAAGPKLGMKDGKVILRPGQRITDEQVAILEEWCNNCDEDPEKVANLYFNRDGTRKETLGELTTEEWIEAVEKLKSYRQEAMAAGSGK